VEVGDGVGEAFFRLGEAAGDGVAVGFFVERFRCLRLGLGVGAGWNIFLIFVPNDSSATPGWMNTPDDIAAIASAHKTIL